MTNHRHTDRKSLLDSISAPIGNVDAVRIIDCATCTAPRDFDDPALPGLRWCAVPGAVTVVL